MKENDDNPLVTIHKKQFVIWNRPIEFDHWLSRPIGDNKVLSWHPALKVSFPSQDTGKIVLGESFNDGEGGNYVEIENFIVKPDHHRLIPVLYGNVDKNILISSSPALIEILSRKKRSARYPELGTGMNFLPSPLTPIDDFRSLLRDQCIDLKSGKVLALDRNVELYPSVDAAIDSFIAYLSSYFKSLQGEQLVLGLTAGLDSRAILAILLANDIRPDIITMNHSQIHKADVRIAKRICRKYDLNHKVINGKKRLYGSSINEQLCRHSNDYVNDVANNILVQDGYYDFLTESSTLIRGSCFEAARHYYADKLQGLAISTVTADVLWARFMPDTLLDEKTDAALTEWINWRRGHDHGLEFCDSYYLDQRVGSWLAGEEQLIQSLPGNFIQPGNSKVCLNAIATGTYLPGDNRQVQVGAIKRCFSDLLKFPINPHLSSSLPARAKRKIERTLGLR